MKNHFSYPQGIPWSHGFHDPIMGPWTIPSGVHVDHGSMGYFMGFPWICLEQAFRGVFPVVFRGIPWMFSEEVFPVAGWKRCFYGI